MDNRAEVREFLSTRRARLTPARAGLPQYGGTRRVPGLRRAEVALLAGVGPDYYVRLERGNLSGVSDSVLEAIACALQLDDAEHAHLHDLARAANAAPRARRRTVRQQIRPGVQRLLDAMTDAPAFVRNGRLAVLAANPLGRALYSPAFAGPDAQVNLARFCFLDPAAGDFYRTGTTPPTPPSRCCAPRPAATPTTRPSPTWSVNSPPAATPSGRSGPRTTCGCTTPASNSSTIPSSGRSASAARPGMRSSCSPAGRPPAHRPTRRTARGGTDRHLSLGHRLWKSEHRGRAHRCRGK